MKEDSFPIYFTATDQQTQQTDAEMFLNHLALIQDPLAVQQNLKPIEENVRLLAKQSEAGPHVEALVKLLCGNFKQVPMLELLSLIKTAINPDLKFEARTFDNNDVLNNKENVRNMVQE